MIGNGFKRAFYESFHNETFSYTQKKFFTYYVFRLVSGLGTIASHSESAFIGFLVFMKANEICVWDSDF